MFFRKRKKIPENIEVDLKKIENEKWVNEYNCLINEARKIVEYQNPQEESNHPIHLFIKQITDWITLEGSLRSYSGKHFDYTQVLSGVFEARFAFSSTIQPLKCVSDEGFSEDDIEYYKEHNYQFVNELNVFVDLELDPIILFPWDSKKTTEAFCKIGKKFNLSDARGNINNFYYFPIGVSVCHGGNHSQYSAKMSGSGVSDIRTFVNLVSSYNYIEFDGCKFNYTINENPYTYEIRNRFEFYGGVLFEIGRLLKDRPEFFSNEVIELSKKRI